MSLAPAKLVEQAAAKDDTPVPDIQPLPVARIGRDAVDGDRLLPISIAAVVLQLVDGVFLGLCNLIRTVVGRVDGVNVIVVSIDLRSLFDQIDGLVTVAAKGVGKIVEARIKDVLLILDCCERILRCSQALGRRSACRSIGRRLRGIDRVVKLVVGILGGSEERAVHRLQTLERRPLPAFLGGAFKLQRRLERVLVLGDKTCLQVVRVVGHRG